MHHAKGSEEYIHPEMRNSYVHKVGSEFQYFGVETGNDLSYKDLRDLGTNR